MIIKLTGVEDCKIADKYPAKRIIGKKIQDGSEWSREIFSNTDAAKQLSNFAEGETINVKMQKDGKFWNVTGVFEATPDEIEAAKEPYKGGHGAGKMTVGGGSKGGWNGRTGEAYDRSAAIYFAFDFMKVTLSDTKLKKLTLETLIDVADEVYAYIHDGKNINKDALTPPDLED